MCDFDCGTMSHAKSLLHWSIIHYLVTLSDILGMFQKRLLY